VERHAYTPPPQSRHPARGRGAQIDPANRFDPIALTVLPQGGGDDDLLHELTEWAESGAERQRVVTRVFRDNAKTVINAVNSPDLPFSWTINPYRGCEHGCVYCYARPTHEYFGLSCGQDFETAIFAKPDAAAILRRELAHPKWTGAPIVMSGVTDAYQPVERSLRITRSLLEVMAECGQPVSFVTKNALVLRDLDLLTRLASVNACRVAVSLTSLRPELARTMEPRASSPEQRLRTIRELRKAGVPVIVMTAPIIPGINDSEVPALLEAAADAGAQHAGWVLLKLPWQVKDVFVDWLRRSFPERADHVESLIRQCRPDGRLYSAEWGKRQTGQGPIAEQIRQVFAVFSKRYGLDTPTAPLSGASFKRPVPEDTRDPAQMRLFGTPE